ncbi:MAG: hypothetical protein R6W97_10920 [Thiobacillus sp.]|jgi:hypothetical protein
MAIGSMEATFTPETILQLELILGVVLFVIASGLRAPLEQLLPQSQRRSALP